MKQCNKCEELKSLDEFGKEKNGKDGLNGRCKLCIAEWMKAYREANKEKCKAYREANKDKFAEKRKAYREANKEPIAEKSKAYREENKEKVAEKNKAYREANKDKIKAWREANKEEVAEKRKAYREANKEEVAEKDKAYREENKEKMEEYNKAWREANKEKIAEKDKAYREANKSKRIEELKQIIEPHTDNEWIYVLQCGLYNKIGFSNDPLRRIPEIEKETGFDVDLLYLAKANYGRTTDTETIIHHDLKHLNIPIPYKSKTVSREWFYGDLLEMVEVIGEYAEIKKVN